MEKENEPKKKKKVAKCRFDQKTTRKRKIICMIWNMVEDDTCRKS
jgi:hypothetical protein